MSLFLILLLIWVPISFVLEAVVDSTPGAFTKGAKHVLFSVLTFPTFWFSAVQSFVGKHVFNAKLNGGVLSKIGAWFKS